MHRLIPTSRSLLSMASAPPRWWRLPLMAASNPPVRRVSRFCHGSQNKASSSGVRGEEKSGKPENRQLIPSARDIMKNVENSDTTKEFIARHGSVKCICSTGRRSSVDIIFGDDEARRTTTDVTDGEQETWGEFGEVLLEADANKRAANVRQAAAAHQSSVDLVVPLNRLPESSHRDGSIYRDTYEWKKDYRIADRTETRLEAMMLSNPTDCDMFNGVCLRHYPRHMLQIFSLKLAKIPVGAGKVELYGYIAARDELEPFLNYVVNISRDDPFTVEQGSLINMLPKRGISLDYGTLIEYDMKIKTGEQEKDDLQLIDGASVIGLMGTVDRSVFTSRMIGDYGAIDISASRLDRAVEVTVEVTASEVQDIFRLCLGCFISGLHEEIRLFDGTIGEPRGLKRYVVAVVMGTQMDLKFKVGAESSGYSEHCCSFTAHQHGHADQLIKTDFASFLVKEMVVCLILNVTSAFWAGPARQTHAGLRAGRLCWHSLPGLLPRRTVAPRFKFHPFTPSRPQVTLPVEDLPGVIVSSMPRGGLACHALLIRTRFASRQEDDADRHQGVDVLHTQWRQILPS